MKLSLAALGALAAAALVCDAEGSFKSLLRAETDCIGKYSTKKACLADSDCAWCVAKAVPSECVTKDQASHLPPGVFECGGTNNNDDDDDEQEETARGELQVTMRTSPPDADNIAELGSVDGSVLSEEEPLCDPDVAQSAGYFRLKDADKHYFFWYFESRNDPATDPVVLWLTGGPGCSSTLALLEENGPCRTNANGDGTVRNPHSWNNNATVIYVDSPPGTGWSYGKLDVTEKQVGKDLYSFLLLFFAQFPQYAKLDFHVYAESYGGKWAPHTATAINEGNKQQQDPSKRINLRSVGIGNGLTKPETQVNYYADMAYKSGTAPPRISEAVYWYMKSVATPAAHAAAASCNSLKVFPVCAAAQTAWALGLLVPVQNSGYNHYDLRIKCVVPGLCYDFSATAKWLNSAEVQRRLGVDGPWVECAQNPAINFAGQEMRNVDGLIPQLLADGIRVLIYAGDCDYICNWLGNKAWTLELDWPQREAFAAAEDVSYEMDGKAVGKERTVGGFTFLQVFEAGHMVPKDQPAVALHMLNDFIRRSK